MQVGHIEYEDMSWSGHIQQNLYTHCIFNSVKPLDSEIVFSISCSEKFQDPAHMFLSSITLNNCFAYKSTYPEVNFVKWYN
jgi:hypothetical protein